MKLGIIALGLLVGFAAHADTNTLHVDCNLEAVGVKFTYDGVLKPSDPESYIEQYVVEGIIKLEDARRPELEFKKFTAVGSYDDSRGVMRLHLSPVAPQLFGAFRVIFVNQYLSGSQLAGISTVNPQRVPDVQTSGKLCSISKTISP
jgi:hypothetical protein